ncbi:hypothetical protein RvY_18282 [Ramazzottius varieornatus]|uniref:Uncharacterized protein n=1 Tax=Ramazzottius varieornatus TaxID=947166 RepID=A0A1D1W568_RAMVA|nr:hypothetical protein RvY_18282 [Ramazzottius varieornatus]
MPYLHRDRGDAVSEKANVHDEGCVSTTVAVSASTTPRRRISKLRHAEKVIISSKYVVESIRDRQEGDGGTEPFWGEYPRISADALEKRGIEVLVDASERAPHKNGTLVKVVELTSDPALSFPSKRAAKGRMVSPAFLPHPPWLKTVAPTKPVYFLSSKDLIWLDCYNRFAADRKISKISADDLERLMSALEVRKNELVMAKMRGTLQIMSKTPEGSLKRRVHEYFALQRFIELTAETLDTVDHISLGKAFSLSSQTSFDIWEYWKCKIQDGFMQPLVFPPAVEFDYRRISLLAAWNLTSISYAQRLRHDAERIRLMYDLMQKRDVLIVKTFAKEEEVLNEVAELCLLPEAKFLSADKLSSICAFTSTLSALERHPVVGPAVIRQWVEGMLLAEEGAAQAPPDEVAADSKADGTSSCLTCFPLAPLEPAPNIRAGEKDSNAKTVRKKRSAPCCVSSTSPMRTRRTQRSGGVVAADHADTSCCENGPAEDEGGEVEKALELGPSVSEETDETLYDISAHSGVSLGRHTAKKPTEFRTRLRSWKRLLS